MPTSRLLRAHVAALIAVVSTSTALAADCVGGRATSITVRADGESIVCLPDGVGPFPGVLYNHGGRSGAVGGDLEATCMALAAEGYVGFALYRDDPPGKTIEDHLEDVLRGLDELTAIPEVDAERIGLIGFSRGALLSFMAAEARPDRIDATVLLAPAPGRDHLLEATEDVTPVEGPVLILVASNDLYQADHVALAQLVADELEAAGKEFTHIVYPEYPYEGCTGCDGHEMFFVVDDEYTDYWCDVRSFLAPLLASPDARTCRWCRPRGRPAPFRASRGLAQR